jgi:hypothetical protein
MLEDGTSTGARKLALIAEILVAYARVRWRMRGGDIRAVVASIRALPADVARPPAGDAFRTWLEAMRLANAVTRTLSVLPTDSRCLVRSLVLLWLLCARGIPSTLVIGTQRNPGFAAHAWLEYGGKPVLTAGAFQAGRLVEI